MTEFSIIEEYFSGVGPRHRDTALAVGDDAAVIHVPTDMELAISVDSMVVGVHFLANADPAALAHKLCAVNLSDMAAMGADPKWATLTLTLPEIDRTWLSAFSASLKTVAEQYNVQLIGGDTTKGPLNLSITIMGLVPKGKVLSRSGARPGDDVYVSNIIGDSALGLQCLQGQLQLDNEHHAQVIQALEWPTPRVTLGQALREIASACLDISDGLIGDLTHICQRSRVAIEIDVDKLPLSLAYRSYLLSGGDLSAALTGGDDYELAFTASPAVRQAIEQLSDQCKLAITRIGTVSETKPADQKVSLSRAGHAYTLPNTIGFEHFS